MYVAVIREKLEKMCVCKGRIVVETVASLPLLPVATVILKLVGK